MNSRSVVMPSYEPGSLITYNPISTGGKWYCCFCQALIQLYLIPWHTASDWHYTFIYQQSHLTHVNRMLVTLPLLCAKGSHHILSHDQQFVSDTALLWWSHHLSFHDQQEVSDTHFSYQAVLLHLIPWQTGSEKQCTDFLSDISCHMIGSKWVTLPVLSAKQSYHLCHDQQFVSDYPLSCDNRFHW